MIAIVALTGAEALFSSAFILFVKVAMVLIAMAATTLFQLNLGPKKESKGGSP